MSNIEDRLQRYLAGELAPEERVAFEDEVLANTELVDSLYADANVASALETAARARRERAIAAASVTPWWRRRMVQWLAPTVAVAALAVFMVVQQPESPEQSPVFRGVSAQVVPIEPQGDVETVPTRFVWSASRDAAFYRFELFDASSTRVYEAVTADTSFTVDAAPARGYWVVSPLNDLRIGAGAPLLTHYKTIE